MWGLLLLPIGIAWWVLRIVLGIVFVIFALLVETFLMLASFILIPFALLLGTTAKQNEDYDENDINIT